MPLVCIKNNLCQQPSRRQRPLLVATASATATTAATAAAVAATSTTAATAAAPLFLRPGFVDGQGTSVVLFTAETSDGRLGLLISAHLDKRKTLAAAGVAIFDHLGAPHCAEWSEHRLQVRTADGIAQIANIQLLTHNSISFMRNTGPLVSAGRTNGNKYNSSGRREAPCETRSEDLAEKRTPFRPKENSRTK